MTRSIGSRYEVGDLLGRGGMGEVFRATNNDTGEAVAVKVLKPEYASDRKLVARFVQERDIVCSLRSPNLVSVQDLVVEGETIAIVMDLVEGGDLRELLQRRGGTMTPEAAIEACAQLLDALAVVHQAGVVHRDVKPENILVPSEDPLVLKLSDFGVARVVGDAGVTTTHTSLIGTPYYMAPELGEGRAVGPTADVYSAGVVLYELIAGQAPFTGPPLVVMRRHSDEEPAPLDELPAPVWDVIADMLAKEPDERPSAAEASRRLRDVKASVAGLPAGLVGLSTIVKPGRLVSGERVSTNGKRVSGSGRARTVTPAPVAAAASRAEPTTRRNRVGVLVGASLVGLLAIVAGIVWWGGGSGPEPPPPTVLEKWEIQDGPAPDFYTNGLAVTRKYGMTSEQPDQVRVTVTATSTRGEPITKKLVEVIPKSLAPTVDAITFTPAAEVLERDPVVQYDLANLTASRDFSYVVKVGSSDKKPAERLKGWLADRSAAVTEYRKTHPEDGIDNRVVKSIELASNPPSTEPLEAGKQILIAAKATYDDGQTVPDSIMKSVAYSVDNPSILGVVGNGATAIATAFRPGTATVTVKLAPASATVSLTVPEPKPGSTTVVVVEPGGGTGGGGTTTGATGGGGTTVTTGGGGGTTVTTGGGGGTTVTTGGTTPKPPAPVASFNVSATSVQTGTSIDFSDTSSNSPTSWQWSFGDGATASGANASHSYSSAGSYTVTLAVSNAGGSSNAQRTVTVTSPPPPPPPPETAPAAPTAFSRSVSFNSVPFSGGSPHGTAWGSVSARVTVSWRDNSSNEDGFRVTKYSEGPLCSSQGESFVADVAANSTSATVTVTGVEYYPPGNQAAGCLTRLYVYAMKAGFAPQRSTNDFAVVSVPGASNPTIVSYTRNGSGGTLVVDVPSVSGWVTHEVQVNGVSFFQPGSRFTINLSAAQAAQCVNVQAFNTDSGSGVVQACSA